MNRAYKVILSNKIEIKIDEDELPVVLRSISSGSVCKMRQGIFNPSFFVAIVEDEGRLRDLNEAINSAETRKMVTGEDVAIPKGFLPLKDIFEKEDNKKLN